MYRTEISPEGIQTIIELSQNEIDQILANQSAPPEPLPQPAPIAFYEEMIGATGGTALTGVFNSIVTLSLSNTDTSSLVSVITQITAALTINDWRKPYAPYAFAPTYTMLKSYLTIEQIAIVDEAIARYHLGVPNV